MEDAGAARNTFIPETVTPPAVVAEHLAFHGPVVDAGGVLELWEYLRVPTEPGGYAHTHEPTWSEH